MVAFVFSISKILSNHLLKTHLNQQKDLLFDNKDIYLSLFL